MLRRAQHEQRFLYHPESLSVRPEPVEGLRESFLQPVRVGGAELFAGPLINHLAANDCHID